MNLISQANQEKLKEMELAHHGNTDVLADNMANINNILISIFNNYGGKPENKIAYIRNMENELIQLVINVR